MMETKTYLKEVLAIVNDKGGTGKTTTVHNLANGLIQVNPQLRVLILDLDAQRSNVSLLCGWQNTNQDETIFDSLVKKTPLPIYKVRDNLYLTPANEEILTVEPFLLREVNPLKVLCDAFERPINVDGSTSSIIDLFDYVLIDCPPSMNLLTRNALSVATGIIIPVQLEVLPTFGSSSVIRWAEEVKSGINPNLELRGILRVMVDQRKKVSSDLNRYFESEFGRYLFKTKIPRRTKIVESQAMLQDIFTYSPKSDAAKSYLDLAREIIESSTT